MKKQENLKEMKELVAKLNHYAKVYYSSGTELVSNKEYDTLYEELEKMEAETGVILNDSPTQKVGYEVVDHLQERKHKYPAKSLDKTKDIQEFKKTFQDGEIASGSEGVVTMWKMDGCTLQVTFSRKLISAVTRGSDGVTGYDVSHNAPFLHGLPRQISEVGEVTVRGEVVMKYKDFEQINDNLPAGAVPFENARNLANGTIRSYDSSLLKSRPLHFVAYTVVDHPEYHNGHVFTKEDSLQWLESQGFEVVPYEKSKASDLKDVIERWTDQVPDYEYPVDGLVTALNDQEWAMQQYSGSSKYAYSMVGYALKWKDELAYTKLRDIEWSPSRTGLLNPVAVFDPVRLEGTTVTRATIHNVSEVLKLGLEIGNEISVYKANKIIPAIYENRDQKKTWDAQLDGEDADLLHKSLSAPEFPKTCPCCGGAVKYIQSENETKTITVSCVNPDCPAKHIGKYERLVSKEGLNVKGLAGAAIAAFVEKGWLAEYADLFELKEHAEEIKQMEGFGEKSCQDMLAAIEKSRNTTFRQFYYSLGIPGSGKDDAKIFERELTAHGGYGNNSKIKALLGCVLSADNAIEVMTAYDGIGEKTARTIKEWYIEHSREVLRYLNCVNITDDEIKKDAPAATKATGKTFVITGKLEQFENRAAFVAKIEAAGGKVSGSVSKKTDYLINNDITSTSGKNKKAADLGIPVITEQQAIEMLKIL